MSRTVKEWIGKTANTPIPPRVKVRVFEKAGGRCALCTRKITPGDAWQCDHIIALVNGGSHSEDNLQCLCAYCHKAKTADDVAEKSRVRRIRAKHLGIRKAKAIIAGSKASKWKKKLDGTVVER